jgi:hypothetical protein
MSQREKNIYTVMLLIALIAATSLILLNQNTDNPLISSGARVTIMGYQVRYPRFSLYVSIEGATASLELEVEK